MTAIVRIREAKSEDMPLVLSSWLTSYRYGRPGRLRATVWDYTNHMSKRVRGLVERGARIDVAHWHGDVNLVLGWWCYESPNLVHYVYTKRIYREQGIARLLVGQWWERPCIYTHKTRGGERVVPSWWIFDPMRLEEQDADQARDICARRTTAKCG